MTRHYTSLAAAGSHLAAHAVGVAPGNVEEFPAARCLIMGTGRIHHVTQVIQLVAQVLLLHPSLLACPLVRLRGIDGTCRIEVAVGLLSSPHYVEHRVDIVLQHLVVGQAQHIAGTLDGLIDIGIVERETHELAHVPFVGFQPLMSWMLQRVGRHCEIIVAVLALALAESQRNSYRAGSLHALSPECVGFHLHLREAHLIDGIAVMSHLLFLSQARHDACHNQQYHQCDFLSHEMIC